MYATYLFLPSLFPYPDESLAQVSPKEYEDNKFKVSLLHYLVYTGVFLLGSNLIYSKYSLELINNIFLDNGKSFCDDTTRFV